MAPDYDALSDGSDLTGQDSASFHHSDQEDEEAMPSAPHTPSKKRRRLVRTVQDEDDEEDDDEVADQLDEDDEDDEDVVVDEDADELEEDDDDYDAPSSSRKAGGSAAGRRTTTRAAATPKRSARASTRTAAASAASAAAAAAATPPTTSAKKSLRVKLTRTPNSAATAAAKEGSSSPAPAAAGRGRPSRAAAAGAPNPPGRKPKDATKVKWKPRAKGKHSDSEDDEIDALRTPSEDDHVDPYNLDPSRADTVDPDAASDSAGSDSEPDEATAAEMQAIIGKTARQLAREGGVESEHMELPMFDPNRKKKLTENEIALRRSETARKRKNQVEKKLEDDKVETINRLLKKQVGRSRNKLPRAGSAEDSDEEAEQAKKRGREELSRKALKEMPAPFYRSIDRADGTKVLAVPTGPPLVEEVWGSNYVKVKQALIQELDTPVKTEGLSEKAKFLEERARKRLKQQGEVWKEEHDLEQLWGQEGLYEYKLRTALGQSRKDWIGSRRPPTPEKEQEAEAEEQEEDAEEEKDANDAADDAEENKEEEGGDDAEAE
ncbi:uncharacterized protein UHOD_06078 [Ustilago sp. UG-2017b]|nr:uncharacterized protein UHOD_06078 [Ustilago sp. UG-2017b]